MVEDPYAVLGLSHDATESQIKKAYHKAALKYHPDRQNNKENDKEMTDKFAEISEAYETLTDPVKRYDWRQKFESNGGSSKPTTPPPPPPPPPPPASTPKTPSTPKTKKAPSTPRRGDVQSPRRPSVRSNMNTTAHSTANMSTSYRTHATAASSPVTNSSKRAEFMQRKQKAQEESQRSLMATPVSARRSRQSFASGAPPSSLNLSSHRGGGGGGNRRQSFASTTHSTISSASGRSPTRFSPTRRSVTVSPHFRRKVHGMAVNMDGSIRSGTESPVQRKTSSRRFSNVNHHIPQPPMSASAGPPTQRKRPSSYAPSTPSSQPRRSMSSGPSYRMPDISLPPVKTEQGKNYLRTSVRVPSQASTAAAAAQRAQSPKRSQSPKRPSLHNSTGQLFDVGRKKQGSSRNLTSSNHNSTGQLNFEPGSNHSGGASTSGGFVRTAETPLRRGKKPQSNKSLMGGNKKTNQDRTTSASPKPQRRNSFVKPPSFSNKNKNKQPSQQEQAPVSPQKGQAKRRNSFVRLRKPEAAPIETLKKEKRSSSQPPSTARKSMFGSFSLRKVDSTTNNNQDLSSSNKKSKKEKHPSKEQQDKHNKKKKKKKNKTKSLSSADVATGSKLSEKKKGRRSLAVPQ